MAPEHSFLETFFGPGNAIPWDGLTNAEVGPAAKVKPWADRYLTGGRPAPLPRVRAVGSGMQTTWYVVVDDLDSANLARSEIQGFLGPSYTDWDPLVDRFDPEDGIDRFVRSHHPHALKVTITGSATGESYHRRTSQVRERLELWLAVRERQPARIREEHELLADLIYRFEDALRLGRLDLAEENLRKMEGVGGLSADNLAGLEFLYLDAKSAWGEIWRMSSYERLVEAGPPRRVGQAMLRAAYRCELEHYERQVDPKGALRTYAEVVAPRGAPLLGTSRGVSAPEAHVLRLLKELTLPDRSWSRIESAKAQALKAGASEAWLDALIDEAEGVGPETGVSEANAFARVGREFGLNNLDTAWALATSAEASVERSIWLMRLALEAESVGWAHDALAAVSELGPSGLDEVTSRLRGRVQARFGASPGEQQAVDVPGGWLEWANRLGESERFKGGVSLAEDGRTDWSVEAAAEPDWLGLAEALSSVTEANEPVLRRSIPHLLSAIGEDPPVRGGLEDVYERLLDVVLLDPAPGDTHWVSLEDLIDRRLSQGIGAATYATLLQDLGERVEEAAAPVNLPDLLDLVDLLFFRVCPSQEARLRFVTSVLNQSLAHIERLPKPVLAVLSELARSAEWPQDPFAERLAEVQTAEPSEQQQASSVLDGLTVALYSLNESGLGRAEGAIQRITSGVDVRLYSDKVASESLLAAARNADLFVVAHKSAKHAATEAIQAARVGPLVFAQGKGSSSLVRAVWEWAEERAALGCQSQ